ncbi:MAG: hypothetical protein ABFD81_09225 [Syntrophaceae bacterium]
MIVLPAGRFHTVVKTEYPLKSLADERVVLGIDSFFGAFTMKSLSFISAFKPDRDNRLNHICFNHSIILTAPSFALRHQPSVLFSIHAPW